MYPDLIREERRKSNRLAFRGPLRYQLKGQPNYYDTIIRDVSEGGLRFITDQFVPNFSEILLEFSLRPSIEPICAAAKVAWAAKLPYAEKYQVGVQFTKINNCRRGLSQRLQEYKNYALNPA